MTTILSGIGWLKSLLGITSTILVGGFVAYQYFDSKWKSRIERSLEYSIMYQAPEKIAARNASTLWPPPTRTTVVGALDPDFVTKITKVLPQIAEQSLPASLADADPDFMAQSREIMATQIASRLAERIVNDMTTDVEQPKWPDTSRALECHQTIDSYVDKKLDDSQYKEHWRHDILSKSGLATKWGTLKEIEGQRHYSGHDGAYYSYAWPYMLTLFFYDHSSDAASNVCAQIIQDYESALMFMSSDILDRLHELKHFYAAVSICTTSGLCDSLVACEVFNGDVNNFVTRWQDYMELWSAQEREVEYWRLQDFISHCFSNALFLDYSEKKLSWYYGAPMLYLKSFTNFW